MELCHQQAGGAEAQDQLTTMEGAGNTDNVKKDVGMRRKFRLSFHLGCPVTMQLLDILFYVIVNCSIYESNINISTLQ